MSNSIKAHDREERLHALIADYLDRESANEAPDRTARIWDAQTGQLRFVLSGHERSIAQAEFSKDSRWLVTVSEDRTARVWDLTTGKEFITLRGHADAVKTASFTPDGRSVLTVSWDGTARLWPVDPLPLAQARRPRELTAEERERFDVDMTRRAGGVNPLK
jgi:WD40 repeat protein